MFCDKCHWYTAGEKICPHCGAPQGPEEAVPEAPAPEPEPAPAPAPKPAPVPAPMPAPAPAPAPKPAPTPPDSNKQGFKALAIVITAALAFVFVLFFVEMARDDTSYNYGYEQNDYYDDDFWFETAGPSLKEAQAGDVVAFGSAQWRVLDKESSDTILLLLEYEIAVQPEEAEEELNQIETNGDTIYLAGIEFFERDFERIQLSPEGNRLFLLSAEEMAYYDVEPPEYWNAEFYTVRPAMWVTLGDIW